MLCSKRQINGEDFINFHGFLKKYELKVDSAQECFGTFFGGDLNQSEKFSETKQPLNIS